MFELTVLKEYLKTKRFINYYQFQRLYDFFFLEFFSIQKHKFSISNFLIVLLNTEIFYFSKL
jgi:hypothetical protein